jgi:DMSO/TMAO reductase YedYZ heme-binding membrane subunit
VPAAPPHRSAILGTAAVLTTLALVIPVHAASPSADDLLVAIRYTARLSLVAFLVTFATRPALALWPGPATKWAMRHRRYLGLAMAISHGGHALAIIALALRVGPSFLQYVAMTSLVGGAIGYGLLGAMVATSSDRAVRVLGHVGWRRLHRVGMYLLALIFLSSYAGRAGHSLGAAVATAGVLAVFALRAIVACRQLLRRRLSGA